jgi:hypothetical protein
LDVPDFSKSFVVTTDASDLGLGAVLEQDGRPVAYESRKFNAAELNYTVTEKELLAVVHALRVWRCYLESSTSFLVCTDHNPNVFFQSKPSLSRREARWNDCLQQFNFQWEYVKGVSNVVADPLSRSFAGLACLSAVTRQAGVSPVITRIDRPISPADVTAVVESLRTSDVLPTLDAPGSASALVDVTPSVLALPPSRTALRSPRLEGGRDASLLARMMSAYQDDPLVSEESVINGHCVATKACGGVEARLWCLTLQLSVMQFG